MAFESVYEDGAEEGLFVRLGVLACRLRNLRLPEDAEHKLEIQDFCDNDTSKTAWNGLDESASQYDVCSSNAEHIGSKVSYIRAASW